MRRKIKPLPNNDCYTFFLSYFICCSRSWLSAYPSCLRSSDSPTLAQAGPLYAPTADAAGSDYPYCPARCSSFASDHPSRLRI